MNAFSTAFQLILPRFFQTADDKKDDKHDDKHDDDKDKPPPSGGYPGGYPGYAPPSTGGYPSGGYYPPPPQEGTGGYYPPPQEGTAGYYPPPQYGDGYAPPPQYGNGYAQASGTPPPNTNSPNDDIPLLDDAMFDDAFYAKDACQLVTFNESFFFETASVQIGLGGSSDASEVGSQFLFAQNIYTPTGKMINDTLLSGICTRTSPTGLLGTSGAGACQFNFVDVHGNYTISAQGHLDTVASQQSAGNLVVTGGSGHMVSVVGEMKVVPVDTDGLFTTADIFTGIYAYYVEAVFGVIICPALTGQ